MEPFNTPSLNIQKALAARMVFLNNAALDINLHTEMRRIHKRITTHIQEMESNKAKAASIDLRHYESLKVCPEDLRKHTGYTNKSSRLCLTQPSASSDIGNASQRITT